MRIRSKNPWALAALTTFCGLLGAPDRLFAQPALCIRDLMGPTIMFPERRARHPRTTAIPPRSGWRGWLDRVTHKAQDPLWPLRGANSTLDAAAIKPAILASETGSQELSVVRINLPKDEYGDVLDDYDYVLTRMPRVKLVVIIEGRPFHHRAKFVESRISPGNRDRVSFTVAPAGTMWAQDGSKPLAAGNATLMQSSGVIVQRPHYNQATRALKRLRFAIQESQLPFEGGNVIVGDFHVFMGSDQIEYVMDEFDVTRSEVLNAYERQFGKPILEIGVSHPDNRAVQPAFHIDLFMTVARDWRKPGVENVVLLKDYSEASGETRRELAFVSTLLKMNGYRVIPIPGSFEKPYHTYNNAILSGRTALVPSYRTALDDRAYEIYEELGYTVISMPSSRRTILSQGAIRCVSETYRQGCVRLEAPEFAPK